MTEASMVLEIADLRVRSGQSRAFEAAFADAQRIIASAPGDLGHELQRCLETDDRYVLLVRWTSVDDHESGFRGAVAYHDGKRLLHHFYDPFPTVLHFERVAGAGLGEARP
jgi:heme-degrading monooxygenase HmoA